MRPDELPSTAGAELERLAPDRVVVLDSTGAVSTGVVEQIDVILP